MAPALSLSRETKLHPAFLAHHMGSDGTGAKHVYRTGLATELNGTPFTGEGKLVQNGREVYRFAVSTVPQGIEKLLEKSGLATHGH